MTRDAVGALVVVAGALAVMAGARCLPALQNPLCWVISRVRVAYPPYIPVVLGDIAGTRCLPALHPGRVGDAAGAAALTRRQASQSASRAVTQYPIVFFFSNISLAVSGR